MLSSAGFFNDALCPFFKTGLCERPYCHFKHALSSKSQPALQSHKGNGSASSYVPTPVHKLKKVDAQITLETSSTTEKRDKDEKSSTASSSSGPAYKPTPISELKKLREEVKKRKASDVERIDAKKVKAEKGEAAETSSQSKEFKVITKKVSTLDKATSNGSTVKAKESKKERPSYSSSSPRNSDSQSEVVSSRTEAPNVEDTNQARKLRIAHLKLSDGTAVSPSPKKCKLSASAIMFNRFKGNEKVSESTKESSSEELSNPSPDIIAGKKRVAHSVKADVLQNIASKRPSMPLNHGSGKVALAVRQKYLGLIIDECLKCHPTDKQDAFDRGLREEKQAYDKSKSKIVYVSMAVNVIKRLRNESGTVSTNTAKKVTSYGHRVVSHQDILNGPNAANCSIEKKHKTLKVEDLNEIMLYSCLKKYVMSQNRLIEYGYPILDSEKDGCVILPPVDSKTFNDFKNTRRVCSRCKKTFYVDDSGIPLEKEPCNFHYGRLWNMKSHGSVERKYSCCQADQSAGGCGSASSHVVEGYGHPDYCRGFVKTKTKKIPPETSPGIYALDCEMCNTTIGIELTRVSVIDSKSKQVYETLVKPSNPVLDYNTKFSGIKEGDLDHVTTTLQDVQKHLLKLFNESSILIGHSLESDLKALKLVHNTVIDTAEVFPHRRGLPFKRALRTLVAEFLLKIIQDEVAGHDSQEDARSCLQLILMKIGSDLAKLKPKS